MIKGKGLIIKTNLFDETCRNSLLQCNKKSNDFGKGVGNIQQDA